MSNDWKQLATDYLNASIDVKRAVVNDCLGDLVKAAELVACAFGTGHKLLICGNGGSAADSQHIAAEFVGRLTKDFERPAMPAIALTTDTSVLTAISNDYGFHHVFARQVEAIGGAGDVLLGISTSGDSASVVGAVTSARERGMVTIGLLGNAGGQLRGLVDHAIIVPSSATIHIQESQIALYHILVAIVERTIYPTDGDGQAVAKTTSDS